MFASSTEFRLINWNKIRVWLVQATRFNEHKSHSNLIGSHGFFDEFIPLDLGLGFEANVSVKKHMTRMSQSKEGTPQCAISLHPECQFQCIFAARLSDSMFLDDTRLNSLFIYRIAFCVDQKNGH